MSAMAREPQQQRPLSEEELKAYYRAKRGKNLALLATLVGFIVLVYLVSLVRMGG